MDVSVAAPGSAPAPVTGPASGAPPEPGGLPVARRERKKQQLREALIGAALALFEAKGYEHTAVHEITDAVDVSERTFFRYFAGKEDLALSFLSDRLDSFLGALEERPAAEEPLTAIRNAFHDSLRGSMAAGGLTSYLSVTRLTEVSPGLLAANMRLLHDREDEIVGVLARREGVNPATDRRPRLVAALFAAIAFLANREWSEQEGAGPDAMAAAFDAYADQLLPAVAGHWRGSPAAR